jgi:hypothetical protein
MNLPTINERQKIAKKRVRNLETKIQEVINTACEEDEYQITYVEINAALLSVMNSNNRYEMHLLCEVEPPSNNETNE